MSAPGKQRGFDDPAHATGSEDKQLAVFRRVRDEIRQVFEAYAAGRTHEQVRQQLRYKPTTKDQQVSFYQDLAPRAPPNRTRPPKGDPYPCETAMSEALRRCRDSQSG